MEPIVRLENVHYHYSSEGTGVLHGISLSIYPGEFIALIGGNGSGKTTLAKHFNSLYQPTTGHVFIEGKASEELKLAQVASSVGYCYQNPDHQIFQSTIEEEVAYGPKNLGLSNEEIERRVTAALQAVHLENLRHEAPFFLGRGERQKIAVASILAMEPRLIVLDEPTTGLDYWGARQLMQVVDELHQKGHAILFITHDMELVAQYAKRVIVLHEGQVVLDDTPRAAFAQPDKLALAQVEPPTLVQLALRYHIDPLPMNLVEMQAWWLRAWKGRDSNGTSG
ncbi:energy-coupling factor ABC transporter ATP-binding protein [Rubeoparvulum massiliense]|uniref:energy-coupling factor ABC transporter ATP-binding protein n=1 Tax=Rubeoparvulum massiliense TaxID=1631346 RepID=UPI00065DF7CB|nr:ABC transporter ATP-binding protein [Rubeoparvulum massiliense]